LISYLFDELAGGSFSKPLLIKPNCLSFEWSAKLVYKGGKKGIKICHGVIKQQTSKVFIYLCIFKHFSRHLKLKINRNFSTALKFIHRILKHFIWVGENNKFFYNILFRRKALFICIKPFQIFKERFFNHQYLVCHGASYWILT